MAKRGRIPSVDSLVERMAKLEKTIERGRRAETQLAEAQARFEQLKSPEFREQRKAMLARRRRELARLEAQLAELGDVEDDDGVEDD